MQSIIIIIKTEVNTSENKLGYNGTQSSVCSSVLQSVHFWYNGENKNIWKIIFGIYFEKCEHSTVSHWPKLF